MENILMKPLPIAIIGAFVVAAAVFGTSNFTEAANCSPPLGGVAAAWGGNFNGQLGDGTTDEHDTPVPVQNLSGVAAIAGGGAHSLALKNDFTLWTWGLNSNGQLGDGTTMYRTTPVQVNLTGVTKIAGGYLHSLALKNDGTVWAWGWNDFGQLGDGTFNESHIPVQVQNLSGVTAIATGDNLSLALKNDGTIWTWGQNGNGQLGDGTTTNQNKPVQVVSGEPPPNNYLSGVQAMDAGTNHSLALKGNGLVACFIVPSCTVWAWGQNGNGQLGDGTFMERHIPVRVQNLSGVKAIASGSFHSLALKNDGTVWAWGQNDRGQLGDGHTTNQNTPVPAQNISGVAAIASHDAHSLALKNDGTVWAWGWNDFGQLGDGHTTNQNTPVPAQNISGVAAIATGLSHSLAVGNLVTQLTVFKILQHPDHNHLRLFNLQIDGVTVRANVNGGSTGPQVVSPGKHTVSETGGTGTSLGALGTMIGGDCAADGTVNLALGDNKTCTITNFDHAGGCPPQGHPNFTICCEPGDGTQGCLSCGPAGSC
jgi:alpha-tubulin suppressor-like RCC1 family protein